MVMQRKRHRLRPLMPPVSSESSGLPAQGRQPALPMPHVVANRIAALNRDRDVLTFHSDNRSKLTSLQHFLCFHRLLQLRPKLCLFGNLQLRVLVGDLRAALQRDLASFTVSDHKLIADAVFDTSSASPTLACHETLQAFAQWLRQYARVLPPAAAAHAATGIATWFDRILTSEGVPVHWLPKPAGFRADGVVAYPGPCVAWFPATAGLQSASSIVGLFTEITVDGGLAFGAPDSAQAKSVVAVRECLSTVLAECDFASLELATLLAAVKAIQRCGISAPPGILASVVVRIRGPDVPIPELLNALDVLAWPCRTQATAKVFRQCPADWAVANELLHSERITVLESVVNCSEALLAAVNPDTLTPAVKADTVVACAAVLSQLRRKQPSIRGLLYIMCDGLSSDVNDMFHACEHDVLQSRTLRAREATSADALYPLWRSPSRSTAHIQLAGFGHDVFVALSWAPVLADDLLDTLCYRVALSGWLFDATQWLRMLVAAHRLRLLSVTLTPNVECFMRVACYFLAPITGKHWHKLAGSEQAMVQRKLGLRALPLAETVLLPAWAHVTFCEKS